MKAQLASLLIVVQIGLSPVFGGGREVQLTPDDGDQKYLAYWLTSDPPAKDSAEYEPVLLLTRLPLKDLQALFDLRQIHDRLIKPGADEPLLEASALTIETYRKDSIWNADRRPLKPVQRFKKVNAETRHVEVNGKTYRYEECPLADVVRLLEHPEGKIPLHRLHAPLSGAKQTACALRLLIKEQLAPAKAENRRP